MHNDNYVICARFIKIPLKRFDFTGEDYYQPIPDYSEATQQPMIYDLTYDKACAIIRDTKINFITGNKVRGSIKRLVDLTQDIGAEDLIDIMQYYIYYLNKEKDPPVSYPTAKQTLYYQRTNGRLVVFNKGITENLRFTD